MENVDAIALEMRDGRGGIVPRLLPDQSRSDEETSLICSALGHQRSRMVLIPDKLNRTLVGTCLCGERAYPKKPRREGQSAA